MRIIRGYKTVLDPSNEQRSWFMRCAGTARFVYNWALDDRIARFKAGEKTNLYEQKRRFNALKGVQFPWIYDVPYALTDAAFVNLDRAYQNFFRRNKQGAGKKGFPRFKSRRRGIGSFTLRGSIHIESGRIKLPRVGWVRLAEHDYMPTSDCKLLSVNMSERAGRWFVCAQVEEEQPDPEPAMGPVMGIDMGLKALAVCSDGTVFENPRPLVKAQRVLGRLNRELSRRKLGGKNRAKTARKLARAHYRVACVRSHALHQISHHVTAKTKPSVIVLEDLNVQGMMANHSLARGVADASMSELRRQIEYKATWNGIEVLTAGQWYASTQLCSGCGEYVPKTLGDRTHVCPHCGLILDRDLNAAMNLASLAL